MELERNSETLGEILAFYERFARLNEADASLEGEAAWAYFKVGALSERLGREGEAGPAMSRAIAILEARVHRPRPSPEDEFRLVLAYDMVDPWSADPASLGPLESRFSRAKLLVDWLVARSPEDVGYRLAQVRVEGKFGTILRRRGQPGEAAACYRRAIELADAILAGTTADPQTTDRARLDRVDCRHCLAVTLVELGRPDEAKSLLDEAAEDLELMRREGYGGGAIVDRLDALIASYRELGESERADDLARRSTEAADPPAGPPEGRRIPPVEPAPTAPGP